jgi:hypothetical protein
MDVLSDPITIERALVQLEEARLLAMRLKQPAVAVDAIVAQCKLAGLWLDRTETTSRFAPTDEAADGASLGDRARRLARMS